MSPKGTRRGSSATLVLASLCLLGPLISTGCGGAAPMPAEPATNDIQELERRLEQHQSELEARFGSLAPRADAPEAPVLPGGTSGGDVGGGEAAEERPEPAGPGDEPAPVAESVEGMTDDGDELSACEVGCQALEGMRRAAARICEVAGTTSDPCTRARTRVGRAEERVTGAGCSCN